MINDKLKLKTVLIIYYILFPVFWSIQLTTDLNAGRFPVNGDSIILPVAFGVFVWLVGFVPFAFILWIVKKANVGKLSLFGINKERFAASILISVFSVFLIFIGLIYISDRVANLDFVTSVYAVVGIYLILCLRVVFMFVGEKKERISDNEINLSL